MRNHRLSTRLPLALSALLAACGSVPTRTFEFAAMNDEEVAMPAIVVVDQEWLRAAENKQFVNIDSKTLPLTLEYPGDRQEIEITVAAIKIDPDTHEITWVPKRSTDAHATVSEHNSSRRLRLTDPKLQLFILGQ